MTILGPSTNTSADCCYNAFGAPDSDLLSRTPVLASDGQPITFTLSVPGVSIGTTLFTGDASLNNPHREDDDKRARLAIRYILGNPGITAPIPGLINAHQVDNVARAIQERRRLDLKERAELDRAGRQMWAKLTPDYQWLRQWEYV